MDNTGVVVRETAARRVRSPHSVRADRTSDTRMRTLMEVLALVVIAALLIAGPLVSRSQAHAGREMSEVRTEAGDSLWAIARAHPIEGLTTLQTVDVIARTNGLDSTNVSTGRTLSVPKAAMDMAIASN